MGILLVGRRGVDCCPVQLFNTPQYPSQESRSAFTCFIGACLLSYNMIFDVVRIATN